MIPKFKTIIELIKAFPDNKACHQYLALERWNGYMECPYSECNGNDPYIFSDGIRYKCKCCKRIYKSTTGTTMEGTKIPLINWFVAFYMLMHKKGITAKQLAKDIGVSYPTAWFLVHRLRTVLSNEKKEKLQGIVEIDESFVGGKNKNRHYNKRKSYTTGRKFKDKTPVFGMLEREGKLIATTIITPSTHIIKALVHKNVHLGTTLMTDEYNAYKALHANYHRRLVTHSKGIYGKDGAYTNNLENFWSHLKRGIIGLYHQVSRKHLDKYVQEFVFKYNYRNHSIQDQFNIFISNMNVRLKYKELIA